MLFRSFSMGIKDSPLVKSVFVQEFDDVLIAPGSPEFLITEDEKKIKTEDGIFLITEG